MLFGSGKKEASEKSIEAQIKGGIDYFTTFGGAVTPIPGKVYTFSMGQGMTGNGGFTLFPDIFSLISEFGLEKSSVFLRGNASEVVDKSAYSTPLLASAHFRVQEILSVPTIEKNFIKIIEKAPKHERFTLFLDVIVKGVKIDSLALKFLELCYPAESRDRLDYKKALVRVVSPQLTTKLLEEYKASLTRESTKALNFAEIIRFSSNEVVVKNLWQEFKTLPTHTMNREMLNMLGETEVKSIFPEVRAFRLEKKI